MEKLPVKPVTVADLIEFLRTQDQDLPVGYNLYSEYCLLDLEEIRVKTCCEHRQDGWIHRYRPDKEAAKYLMFPGN